jgi:hypothetical protein
MPSKASNTTMGHLRFPAPPDQDWGWSISFPSINQTR